MTRFVELNHEIRDGMAPYPGLPSPKIQPILDHEASAARYDHKAEFYLGRVDMPCNVGTYIDSPFHRYPDGQDLSQVALDKVAGLDGLVLDGSVGSDRAVSIDCDEASIAGRAVLIRTGWDERWGTERYWELGPYLGPAAVDLFLRAGPALVGVDFWNVDDTQDMARPAHTRLLAANILIVENLANLQALLGSGFRFYAVPLRIVCGASFPVRAFAEIG